jgi:hypothetical protein
LGALPATTLGYEKRHAWWARAIANYDEEQFVRDLLADQPEAPTYFAIMKRLNRDGMPILGKLPEPPLLSPEAFQKAIQEGAVLVDTRDKFAFAGGHIKGAINIPAGKMFSTWAGWLLPYLVRVHQFGTELLRQGRLSPRRRGRAGAPFCPHPLCPPLPQGGRGGTRCRAHCRAPLHPSPTQWERGWG